MGTQKLSTLALLKTQFDSADKLFSEEFLRGTMLRIANSFWVFACKLLLFLFGFMLRFRFRLDKADCSQKNDFNSKGEDQIASDGSGQKETASAELFSGFQFENSETENSVFSEASASPTPSTSKYQVVSCKGFRGFMEEPETLSITVQEHFMGSNDAPVINTVNEDHKGFRELHLEEVQELAVCSKDDSMGNDQMINRVFSDENLEEFNEEEEIAFLAKTEEDPEEFNSEAEVVVHAKTEDSFLEEMDQANSTEYDLFVNEEMVSFEPHHSGRLHLVNEDEAGLLSENQLLPWDSEPKPNSAIEEVSVDAHKVDPEVTSEYNYMDEEMEETDIPTPVDEKKIEFHPNSEDINRDKEEDSDGYIELEPNLQRSSHLDEELPMKESGRDHEQENLHFTETEPIYSFGKYEEPISSQGKSWGSDSEEDDDEFDILLKHKDLVEQMKMEMKNARIKGLPTILEECESPKLAEDLKPLRIDDKFEHKDCMEEIQKVYKSYAEKMRKLDVLNYQTLHAISFLQLKDPVLQQASGQKSSVSAAIRSVLFPNLWPCNLRRIYADPALKSVTELHRNLEMVYVGQVCLSWEILHWQFGKAKELREHDDDDHDDGSKGHHRPYDQVADEFQQFQVLVQRFVENETFQGPRVQNYAKNRCELRTLLQVPAVKEDCLKDSTAEEESVRVPISRLAEIIDESMRVFWEFLRADHKDEASATVKGLQATHVDVQDHADSELLMDIKTSLHKKEKRLKDILRSGNCIVKKFQKHQDLRMDSGILHAQVELKLVSRVLNMSRLTADQLAWCQKKLNKINFCNRKIRVEPSFLLFPI